jgi:Protein of unknown function (DUF2971)
MTTESRYLYRIMPFEHVVDLFESRELFFASPSSWDDPYERILQHKRASHIFAQCWGTRAVSDAMWRIYSPNRTSVRIRTTRPRLMQAGSRIQAADHCTFVLRDVTYDSAPNIRRALDEIAAQLRSKFNADKALDAMFLKRDAFDYESEVRAVVYLKKPTVSAPQGSLRTRIDPHRLIDSILFDPRAEPTFVKMAKHYLQSALHFNGDIGVSKLYSANPIHIPDLPDEPLQIADPEKA